MNTLVNADKHRELIITDIKDNDDVSCRLQELGFLPGVRVVLENKLPFNGPLAVSVQGAKIALRKEDATRIIVDIPT